MNKYLAIATDEQGGRFSRCERAKDMQLMGHGDNFWDIGCL
jgi:hypothetical protein